jgi:hypothetical protein
MRRFLSTLLIGLLPLMGAKQFVPVFNHPVTGCLSAIVRGSNSINCPTSTVTCTVNLPTGSVVGDLEILNCSAAYSSFGTPSGWTFVGDQLGGIWPNIIFSRVLNSGDIALGSVTCFTTSGGYDMASQIVGFIGSTSGVREADDGLPASPCHYPTSPCPVTTSSGVISSDTILYFGSTRLTTGGVAIPAMLRGCVLSTSVSSSGISSAATYGETGVTGSVTNYYTVASSSGNAYWAVVVEH